MKEMVAVIRIDKMNQTKQALTDCGVDSFFAHEAHGRGKGFVSPALLAGVEEGYEEAASLLGEKGKLYPKRVLTAVVPEEVLAEVVEAVIAVNRSGKPGDGKIYVLPVRDAVRIRTGESGEKSIT